MIILGIDTSTRRGSVAIAEGRKLLGERVIPAGARHSSALIPAIDSLLGECGIDRAELDGIAVGIGPGSFTGIRIALATAQGLSVALGAPIRGIGGMDLLVADYGGSEARICPVIGAQSFGLYAALYEREGEAFRRLAGPFVCPPDELPERVGEGVLIIGPDLDRLRDDLRRAFGARAQLAPGDSFPRAATAALLYDSPHAVGEDQAPLEPLYILPGVRAKSPT